MRRSNEAVLNELAHDPVTAIKIITEFYRQHLIPEIEILLRQHSPNQTRDNLFLAAGGNAVLTAIDVFSVLMAKETYDTFYILTLFATVGDVAVAFVFLYFLYKLLSTGCAPSAQLNADHVAIIKQLNDFMNANGQLVYLHEDEKQVGDEKNIPGENEPVLEKNISRYLRGVKIDLENRLRALDGINLTENIDNELKKIHLGKNFISNQNYLIIRFAAKHTIYLEPWVQQLQAKWQEEERPIVVMASPDNRLLLAPVNLNSVSGNKDDDQTLSLASAAQAGPSYNTFGSSS